MITLLSGILDSLYIRNADIQGIDSTDALKIPGVVRVITAMDIPGANNYNPAQVSAEELLATKQSLFAGQPVAVVVATSRDAAEAGAKAVKVTYANVKSPLLTCQDAIDAKSFFPPVNDLVIGDAASAIKSAPHQISGQMEIGAQFHFHMETQAAVCRPTEDGIDVEAATQWVDSVQDGVAQVLGMTKSRVNVQVKRIGGSYGAKITRSNIIASGCALAAYLVNRPVKFHMNLWDNNRAIGKRFPYLTNYQAGFDNNGKLMGVILDVYGNIGAQANDSAVNGELTWGDNTYNCANWKISMQNCKTNLPPSTWCRAPGSTEAIYFIEYVMEHIAKVLKKPSISVKQANFYKNGDKQITGQSISYCSIADVTTQLLKSADYQNRLQAVNDFNKNIRWRKRGISVTPMKYGTVWNGNQYSCHVAIFNNGGAVAVSHGGVEIGQRLNTKVAQVVAHELNIPLDQVSIKANMSFTSANATSTGGSMTSELCCLAALDCCSSLLARMKPVKDSVKADTPWADLVEKCYSQGIDLSARAWTAPQTADAPICYNTYGVTCCEVETKILTGEYQINRYDVLYDCGESMSPFVDVGQIEGAVIMGLGYYTSEELKYDSKTGELVTYSTWTYKPPSTKDIPIDFRVEILQNAPNPLGVLRSKLVAEPPLCMTNAVVFALRNACNAALDETKKGNDWFQFNAPVTLERFQGYCQLDLAQFTYK
ncbi:uncharacterized protein LOC129585412 [Paramacrobiotus metropolitanus]|uniref:uncharacterized protein LOC129585412 n=1 Tax=Paramacrobiotus metropolitanus TaxID=2943436 RepID=UPI0024458AC9|nr:uncharacterized protein LOC129585412 [Paramacrobiotus metropolitanus]